MMDLLRALRFWWWERQRRIDLEILWPQCCRIASDLDHARAAFAFHAYRAPCWYRVYGDEGLHDYISQMESP